MTVSSNHMILFSSSAPSLVPSPHKLSSVSQDKAAQQVAHKAFNSTEFDEEIGITALQAEMGKVSQKHRKKFAEKVQIGWTHAFLSAAYFVGFARSPMNLDLAVNHIASQQKNRKEYYQNEISNLERELTEFGLGVDAHQKETERSGLDRLFDKDYKVNYQSLTEIREKHLNLTEKMFTLHRDFLAEQENSLVEYVKILTEYHQFLIKEGKGTTKFSSRVEKLLKEVEGAQEKVTERKDLIEGHYVEFQTKYKQKSGHSLRKYMDLMIIYKKYYENPLGTLQLVIEALDEVNAYVLQNPPTEKKRQIMNNLFLAHELLNGDDPNIKLLRFQMEKSLVIDAFFRGFSPSEESLGEDENISENMERFADILEVLPRVIALFEGMKEGSFLPLISLSLFAESFGVRGACILPLLNVALGAYENVTHVNYIQEANKILTQDQRLKFVSFLKVLEKKYADISELQEERNLMSSVREFICIENGHPTTHIFQRIAYDFKDFVRKMRCAGKMERVVRLIGQVVVPAVIITSVVVGVIAGLIGLAPVGAIVASAVMGSIAAICAGGYTTYQASTVLNRLIDEFYLSTAKKADSMRDHKLAQKKLKTFLELNKNKIEELIQKSCAHLQEQIDQGEYDEFLFSPQYEVEFKETLEQFSEEDRRNVTIRRKKFVESEKVKIKARLEAASYIKAHHLTPQAIDEAMVRVFNLGNTFDLLDKILNPSAQLINKEEVMKSAKENGVEITEGTYAALHELSTNPTFKERRKKEIRLE